MLQLTGRLNIGALCDFFSSCCTRDVQLHALVLYRNGTLLAKCAVEPHTTDAKRQLYSMSKSFTATAIGFAVQEGLLRVTDRLADWFSDRLPDTPASWTRTVTVQDLLTMRSGHTADVMPDMLAADDPIAGFFAQPASHAPGSFFCYNNGCTYLLSILLTTLTGQTVFDYLMPRLFRPLGITGGYWDEAKGYSEGALGLHLSCEDAAKLGLLYLQEGVYNGRRLLPAAWCREALTPHADNSGGVPQPQSDWAQGYGYQFWNGLDGIRRADGAFGQFSLMDARTGAVLALFGESGDTQRILDEARRFLSRFDSPDDTPVEALEALLSPAPPLLCAPDRTAGWLGRTYRMDPNPFGITTSRFLIENERLLWQISDGQRIQVLAAGANEWVSSSLTLPKAKPNLMRLDRPETTEIAACYRWEGETAELFWHYLNTPHQAELTVQEQEGILTVELRPRMEVLDEQARRLTGSRCV